MRVYVKDFVAIEIIPEINPEMPELTPERRYPQSFLDDCMIRSDTEKIRQGWIYDPATDTFHEPIEQEVDE